MREALRGLTTRGRSFLAAGLACVVCAFVLGQPDLLAIGLFLALLPLAAAASAARTRYKLACSRTVTPARLPAGRSGRVVLQLRNVAGLPTGVLLVEDTLPYLLGSRPRFILHRLEPGGSREVSYTLRSDVRGRYRIGPLSIRIADPLGLCELTRSFRAIDTLTVTPVVWPMPRVPRGSGGAGSREGTMRALAVAGDDDVAVREYRQGDDMRRIHWRSTAHRGEIMVRREEAPWRTGATLVLDSRAHLHHGEGPGSSFEFACSAAASIGVQLSRGGEGVRLLSSSSGASARAVDATGLLDELALAALARQRDLLDPRLLVPASGLVVAVLAGSSPADAEALLRLSRHRGNVAVLLDAASWRDGRSGHAPAQPPSGVSAAARLRAAGWHVVEVRHGQSLADAWRTGIRDLTGLQGAR